MFRRLINRFKRCRPVVQPVEAATDREDRSSLSDIVRLLNEEPPPPATTSASEKSEPPKG